MLAELLVGFKSFEDIVARNKVLVVSIDSLLEIDGYWLLLVPLLSFFTEFS